ncbi:hypothetical protein [uncultured Tateyamaria sp.]|uniref:hypothetical protein n=1 Tax=uncultured Tateyamaria sp. TaxID=455651 RepID=UPI002618EDB8|nr:hypothetical protein [uncultured Tateyamaria sp.]
MTGIQRTLLAIAAFVAVAVGSFIYFIANWDASKAEPIGALRNASPFLSLEIPRGPGQRPGPALTTGTTA